MNNQCRDGCSIKGPHPFDSHRWVEVAMSHEKVCANCYVGVSDDKAWRFCVPASSREPFGRKAVNRILAEVLLPLVPNVEDRIRIGNEATTKILALADRKPPKPRRFFGMFDGPMGVINRPEE